MQKLQLTFLLTTEDCINANKKNAFVTKISTMIGGKNNNYFITIFFFAENWVKYDPLALSLRDRAICKAKTASIS